LRRLREVADDVKAFGDARLNFTQALRWLREKWGVKRLLCEGGGEVNAALFEEGLVDEVYHTLCPLVFGGRHAPTMSDGHGFSTLGQAARLRLKSLKRVGDELFLVWRTVK
jgi:riboflavin biosynthesis pyrimidine reductase